MSMKVNLKKLNKALEDIRDLLVELEEYILTIDKDELDQLHPEYREKMILVDLEDVRNYNGKCYIAVENDKATGLIMGTIPPYDEYDYLDYKCPKWGRITELIVTSKIINQINFKEEDSLLFIDQTFKNNLDKISLFNVLNIYLKDNRLKTYEEILKEKEEMLKLYDNNKVEEVFEYIIKSDPVLLFSKYIKNNDLENILKFLDIHLHL